MRCKMRCNSISPNYKQELVPEDRRAPGKPMYETTDQWDSAIVTFGAVYEADKSKNPENAIFGAATPYAEFKASIYNKAVIASLVPGKSYYVDFTEAPD